MYTFEKIGQVRNSLFLKTTRSEFTYYQLIYHFIKKKKLIGFDYVDELICCKVAHMNRD